MASPFYFSLQAFRISPWGLPVLLQRLRVSVAHQSFSQHSLIDTFLDFCNRFPIFFLCTVVSHFPPQFLCYWHKLCKILFQHLNFHIRAHSLLITESHTNLKLFSRLNFILYLSSHSYLRTLVQPFTISFLFPGIHQCCFSHSNAFLLLFINPNSMLPYGSNSNLIAQVEFFQITSPLQCSLSWSSLSTFIGTFTHMFCAYVFCHIYSSCLISYFPKYTLNNLTNQTLFKSSAIS